MLAKLLALLAESKGGVVAVVLLAGATTATVAATNTDVQTTVETTIQQLTNSSNMSQQSTDCDHGQPVVVAQRNAADKLLRDAYQTHQKALQDLKQTPDKDKPALNAALRTYDDQLRDELNLGLNKVAALTLGRNGQVTKMEESASPSPTSTATATPTPTATGTATTKPSCSPKPSGSATPTASPSPSTSPSSSAEVKGRVAVAERTTLDANLQQIVDDTIKAMDKTVDDAKKALDNVPAPEHGKPSDNPGNKPSDAGKPSGTPKH